MTAATAASSGFMLAANAAALALKYAAVAAVKAAHPGVHVAVTEPVADYLLTALGADNLTRWTFQADIMNGVDPSPQNTAAERDLFIQHKVKVLVCNQQVTDSLTQSFIALAERSRIPVVGVYETMPAPGYDFQSWLGTEVRDLRRAITGNVSTEHPS